ncbi:RNA-directed DNA polymerase, eukaryota, reverse transcriptase zinc-binding domain protein [Tanacetum coccineum]|uniref:RNA-directed DNA polymerase, eukaryota, reverse transcriptase zinc-binding domain protein n=1 Tax=Tanacetum coccineum TaxID=301880 RepID=A0ABQ4YRK9_9ASTR
MDSSTSSQANQPYSPLNRVTLDMDFEQLINNKEYYQSQDYSMGQGSAHGFAHGSAHGSAPVDDDDSPVEEMSPVKAKKPSKCASRAKKNDAKEKEAPKDWTKAEEIALCQAWCDVSENSEKENSMKAKGFWEVVINYFKKETGSTRGYDSNLSKWKNKVRPRIGCFCAIINNIKENHESDHQGWLEIEMPAFYKYTKGLKKFKNSETTSEPAYGSFNLNIEADEYEKEAREHRPMGRNASKAKKKSYASSREGSSSFVDLVADKYLGIKSTKREKMQEQQDSYIQLKNRELDIQEAARKEAADLKREKLEIQRRKLQLYEKKKRDKDILFYNSVIDPSLLAIQQQKMQEINDEIKETYNLDYYFLKSPYSGKKSSVGRRREKDDVKGKCRKNSGKKCAFKIDLQKAYDTINWDFLERVRYFSGGRGLRQGDPIAPYLFTLVMEVLNLLMKKNISETPNFRYHFGCKKLKITCICFVDDLMVFCNGDISSAKVIKRTLEEFSGVSGLKPNMQKSTIFFGGMNAIEQNNILKIMPFYVGKFPMKYLGVPLITKQISIFYCKLLIEKVEKKVLDWKNRALTYTGRLQLIASVLSSMQMYWASVFLIPKTFINEINKLLKRFLWCQGDLIKGRAKAWPNEWTDKFSVLRNYGVPNLNISGKDVTRWKDKNGKIVDFSVKQVWKDSHADGMRTNWTGMVWYAQCIPKHAFVLWMAVQGRLLTQDRIMKWKPNAILLCPLCEECNDSHEHLFFKCKLSEKIWKYLQAKLCRKYSMDWQTVIVEMSQLKKSKNIWCIVSKLVCGAAVYYLWNERNSRLFGGIKKTEDALCHEIEETIRLNLMSVKVKESAAVRHVEDQWKIKLQRYRIRTV